MNKIRIIDLIRHKLICWDRSLLWLLVYSPFAWSAADVSDFLQPLLSESLVYDTNLYRTSSDSQLRAGVQKDDFINRASVGGLIHKTLSRQVFDLDLRVDDNRYAANQMLNHVSTQDRAVWNWQIGHNWSGKLGAEFSRSLAGFGNTQFLLPDLLDNPAYFFDVRYQLNSNWHLDGGARRSETLHSAVSRQNQNVESLISHGGVTFLTTRGNSVGVDYSHTEAQFPLRQLSFEVGASDIAYQEDLARVLLKYQYSPKLRFEGQAGYQLRDNPHLPVRNFQGEIWRISMAWMPTVKTSVAVSSWHELAAFAELASNYYVSEGVSVATYWAVTEKIVLSGQVRMETQDHTGNDISISDLVLRKDQLFSSQASVSYTPARFAELNLAYQFYQRDSRHQFYLYRGDSVTAIVQFKF